ncbi:hypothetical protein D7Y27_28020 [Corallococcus sp. AB004]|nr:hypothetical protein D7Y27_28020 [Corallococcus sp. AB004]
MSLPSVAARCLVLGVESGGEPPMTNRRTGWLALGMACLLQACTPMTAEPSDDTAVREQSQAASAMTGSLAKSRTSTPLTRLQDGRVLVAGGSEPSDIFIPQGQPFLSSCELYDPATGTWSYTGSLQVMREGASAQLLDDGRVLVAGGYYNTNVANYHVTAELYDPAAGSWSYTGSMSQPRNRAATVKLLDGRVLLAGGTTPQSTNPLSAEFYDATTGTWTATGPMLARIEKSELLPDGRVLGLASGQIVQIYTPATNAWTSLGALPTGLLPEIVVSLADGRVLVAGGGNATVRYASLFHPTTNTWAATGGLLAQIISTNAVRMPDGTVLAFGGRDPNNFIPLTTVQRYTPSTGLWTAEPSLVGGRIGPRAVLLASGDILVAGGSNGQTLGNLKTCERYVSATCVPLSCTSQGAACGTLPDGCGGTVSCGTCGSGLTCSAANACVSDATPPTATLTAPTAGTPVSGTVTLQATASDDVGVTHVEFLDGTKLLGTSSTAPYSLDWNTVGAGDGNHFLVVRAHDATGNAGRSTPVTVQVLNTPNANVAAYDATFKTPRCATAGASCDTGSVVDGRGSVGPELNAPNTLNGACQDGNNGTYHSDESIDRLRIATLDGSPLAPGKVVNIQVTAYVTMPASNRIELYSATNLANPVWQLINTIMPPTNFSQTFTLRYSLPAAPIQAIRARISYNGPLTSCGSGSFDDHDDLIFATQ